MFHFCLLGQFFVTALSILVHRVAFSNTFLPLASVVCTLPLFKMFNNFSLTSQSAPISEMCFKFLEHPSIRNCLIQYYLYFSIPISIDLFVFSLSVNFHLCLFFTVSSNFPSLFTVLSTREIENYTTNKSTEKGRFKWKSSLCYRIIYVKVLRSTRNIFKKRHIGIHRPTPQCIWVES